MICPHCKKAIQTKKRTEELHAQVLQLHREGYSTRDIEAKLERAVSFSTAAKWIRAEGK